MSYASTLSRHPVPQQGLSLVRAVGDATMIDVARGRLLQPLPSYRLPASRHILYGKSECSHIFYAKPLAIRTGEGVVPLSDNSDRGVH